MSGIVGTYGWSYFIIDTHVQKQKVWSIMGCGPSDCNHGSVLPGPVGSSVGLKSSGTSDEGRLPRALRYVLWCGPVSKPGDHVELPASLSQQDGVWRSGHGMFFFGKWSGKMGGFLWLSWLDMQKISRYIDGEIMHIKKKQTINY